VVRTVSTFRNRPWVELLAFGPPQRSISRWLYALVGSGSGRGFAFEFPASRVCSFFVVRVEYLPTWVKESGVLLRKFLDDIDHMPNGEEADCSCLLRKVACSVLGFSSIDFQGDECLRTFS
jgi:hypothetical protein